MTKTRILFVDDEQMILNGLQRLLRHKRGEWEMAFAECGAKALELMEQQPFDVIISDMRMPGMNGAELLNVVMNRFPGTARLILSGHADQDLVMKCVGAAHQYLAKPCDADALLAAVSRACSLERSLQNKKIQSLVTRMDRLPSLPSLYTEMVKVLQDPDASLDDVGKIISRDIGMTAQILKLVNSAFFGLKREISDPSQALTYLGLETVKSLVLSLGTFSQLPVPDLPGFSAQAVWNHSLQTANLAKWICAENKAERAVCEQAFVGGMLHDVGRLILTCNCPNEYQQVLALAPSDSISLTDAEQKLLGVTHADVGSYLLGLWGLPVPVVEVIAYHHSPERSSYHSFTPLTAVHVADSLLAEQAVDGTNDGIKLNPDYLKTVGVADQVADWRVKKPLAA